MDRDFLNDVKFKRDVKLARPSSKETDDQPEERPNRNVQAKVLRLIFFLVICFVLLWTVKIGFESLVGFCTGREHWTVEQMYMDYKHVDADRRAKGF